MYFRRAAIFTAICAAGFAPAIRAAETGTNDFRVTIAGTDGSASAGAFRPAAAYNSAAGEFLAVYENNDTASEGREIYAQRIDGSTGANLGSEIQVSQSGGAGDAAGEGREPAVAWNATENEYLIVWSGDGDDLGGAAGEREIYARTLSADGSTLGTAFLVSAMGPASDLNYAAARPAVAWNSATNTYLAVWQGDDNASPLVDGDVEVFGQLLNGATLAEIGADDFRISDMNGDGASDTNAGRPAVAASPAASEFLVVWEGDEITTAQEIWGQRIDAATGAEVGTNDFRISTTGTVDSDTASNAFAPDIAWAAAPAVYLVVWRADGATSGLADNETEIYGQLLTASGAATGPSGFRASDMGPDNNAAYKALDPAVAWNSTAGEFLVAWAGSDNSGSLAAGEYEIFVQQVTSAGTESGTNDDRASDMGAADGTAAADALRPAAAAGGAINQALLLWEGDDAEGAMTDGEYEIFGQFEFIAVPVELSGATIE